MKQTSRTNECSLGVKIRNRIPGRFPLRRLAALSALVGLVAIGTPASRANDLYNGDLDILGAAGANGQINPGPDGWVINAFKTISGSFADGADSEGFCNVQQPGGNGLFFKPFQGSTNANPALDDYLTVYFYQDNPSSPNTKYTLSGYASCEANCCLLDPSHFAKALFVVEFLDNGGNVISSNAIDLVANNMPTNGPGSMALLTTPQYTAPANTVTVRVGAFMLNAWGTSGAQSFFVDAFDLESVPAPGSPVITNQPTSVTVPLGGTASFSVGVSNTAGVSYLWQSNGVAMANNPPHITGANTATLTITGVQAGDIAHYQTIVSNSFGLSRSKTAALALLNIQLDPAIIITGNIGDTYEVDYTTSLTPPVTWTPLYTTVKLTTSPQPVFDTSGLGAGRFYRAVFLH